MTSEMQSWTSVEGFTYDSGIESRVGGPSAAVVGYQDETGVCSFLEEGRLPS